MWWGCTGVREGRAPRTTGGELGYGRSAAHPSPMRRSDNTSGIRSFVTLGEWPEIELVLI
jgi:hypothetical protein